MFSIIENYAEKSETIRQSRENAGEMSFFKEIRRFIVLFFILILVISIVQFMFYDMNAQVQTPLNFLFVHLSFIFSPILIYFYITKIEKRSLRSIGFAKGNFISSTLKGLLIGILIILAIVIIGVLFGQFKYDSMDLSSCLLLIIYRLQLVHHLFHWIVEIWKLVDVCFFRRSRDVDVSELEWIDTCLLGQHIDDCF